MTPQAFLEKMVGNWQLTGTMMGTVELEQSVEARLILSGKFVEMRCTSTLSDRPYEALYLIGYSEKEDKFVMSLFDTFGVALQPIPGVGQLEGNAVSFVFDYGDPFTNRIEWHPEDGSWTHTLSSHKESGVELFALKRLSPM